MKKLLLSGLAILLAMGLMGASFAYFSDTETSEGNTFTAGTFGLELDGLSLPMHAWNMVPGYYINPPPFPNLETHGVQNVGTIAGEVWFTMENLAKPTGTYAEPTEPAHSRDVTAEEFAEVLHIKIWADYLSPYLVFTEDEVVYEGSLLNLKEAGSDRFPIAAAGEERDYVVCQFVVWLPSDVGNDYQADGVEWDILWHGSTEITIY